MNYSRLFALAVAVLCLALPALADDPKPSTKPAGNDRPVLKVEGDTPEKILASISANARKVQSVEDLDVLVAALEKLLKDDKAAAQKGEARQLLTRLLYMGSMRFKEKYENRFNTYVDNLVKEMPGSDEAGAAVCFRWAKTHIKQGKFDPAGEASLLEIGKNYPKSEMVGQLFSAYADQFEDDKAAVEFLKKAVGVLGNSPTADTLKGLIVNKSIVGSVMEITGPTLEGKSFNLADLKGKVVLVDFWATWCGPCIREMPHVKKVYEKYKDKGFVVIGISLDEDKDALAKFVKEKEIPWTQVFFPAEKDAGWNNPLAKKFGINGIPATFLVGKDGKVVGRDFRGEAKLEKAVADALGIAIETEKK